MRGGSCGRLGCPGSCEARFAGSSAGGRRSNRFCRPGWCDELASCAATHPACDVGADASDAFRPCAFISGSVGAPESCLFCREVPSSSSVSRRSNHRSGSLVCAASRTVGCETICSWLWSVRFLSSSFFPVGLRIGDLPEGRMRANKADVSRQSSASFFVCSCQSREFTFHRSCGFILVQSWYKPVKNTRELCGWKFAFFQ